MKSHASHQSTTAGPGTRSARVEVPGTVSPSPYAAVLPDAARRAHPESPDPLRPPFDLDRHRIIECMGFRRLEGKTQVFAPTVSDHFRTRMTHTLEVANIARCLADRLGMNAALAEAIALAHDLGHPPFGHAGEKALRSLMEDHGGFNHNTHSIRVVEYLEHPFPQFRGLNLTDGTRAGLRDHETRYDQPGGPDVTTNTAPFAPAGPSVEAVLASVADRIAYDCHDLEDAIGAGFLDFHDLTSVTLWRDAAGDCSIEGRSIFAVRRLVIDRIMNRLLSDLIDRTRHNLAHYVDHPQGGPFLTVAFTEDIGRQLEGLEQFLLHRVYRREEVAAADQAGRRVIEGLFAHYLQHPETLPHRFRSRIDRQGKQRVICDYVAGMTDRFCRAQFEAWCPQDSVTQAWHVAESAAPERLCPPAEPPDVVR